VALPGPYETLSLVFIALGSNGVSGTGRRFDRRMSGRRSEERQGKFRFTKLRGIDEKVNLRKLQSEIMCM
jgi:hypothetical protein